MHPGGLRPPLPNSPPPVTKGVPVLHVWTKCASSRQKVSRDCGIGHPPVHTGGRPLRLHQHAGAWCAPAIACEEAPTTNEGTGSYPSPSLPPPPPHPLRCKTTRPGTWHRQAPAERVMLQLRWHAHVQRTNVLLSDRVRTYTPAVLRHIVRFFVFHCIVLAYWRIAVCGGCWRMDMHRRGCMLSFLLRASFSSFSPSPTSPPPPLPPPASLSLSRARGHSRRAHHPRWGKDGWVVACVRVGAARVLLSTFQHAICAHRLFLLW